MEKQVTCRENAPTLHKTIGAVDPEWLTWNAIIVVRQVTWPEIVPRKRKCKKAKTAKEADIEDAAEEAEDVEEEEDAGVH